MILESKSWWNVPQEYWLSGLSEENDSDDVRHIDMIVFLKVRMNLQHGLNTRRESISRVGIYMNMFRFMWSGEIDFSRDVYSIYVPDFR